MDKTKPVIFLAFANDRSDPETNLRYLPEEARWLRKVLEVADRKGWCEIVERPNVTAEELFDVFQDDRYSKRIAVFHFGGHANDYQLLLENAEGSPSVADAGGLATFLSTQQGLAWVFLNACATKGHVQGLLDAGVNAVIATAQAIDDKIASDFSHRFYKGLVAGNSLEQAFVATDGAIRSTRSTELRHLFDSDKRDGFFEEDRLWALYPQPISEEAASWNLADAAKDYRFPLPPTPSEKAYLRLLRLECDRLPLAEEEREAPQGKKGKASLANVYVDLETQSGPDFDYICDRLQVPVDERDALREALLKTGREEDDLRPAEGAINDLSVLQALAKGQRSSTGRQKGLPKVLRKWIKDEETLAEGTKPITALEGLDLKSHLVLLGDPGSGKSTFVNHLAYVLAGALLDEDAEWQGILEDRFEQPMFPYRIVARRWSGSLEEGTEACIDLVYDVLASLHKNMSLEEVLARLERPDTLVMFDGLDEVPVPEVEGDYDRRCVLIESVVAFQEAHRQCKVLVTSRIKPYQIPNYQLRGWPDYTLAKLDDPRIQRFVGLWYDEIRQVERMEMGKVEVLQSRLLEAVTSRSDLHEMAEIPLLLTMLTLVNRRHGLPENRAALYDRCTEQLLWEWEKPKAEEGRTQSLDHLLDGIEPRRERPDIEQVLWELTFQAHRQSGKHAADLDVNDLRNALAQTPPVKDENWAWANRMVRFSQARSGLLIAQDDDTFTYPHRSFQEYMAARRLLQSENPPQLAVSLSRDENWREVILLACGYLAFRRMSWQWGSIVGEMAFALEDNFEFWQASLLAGIALREYGPEKVEGRIGRQLRDELPSILTNVMQNPDLPPAQRLEAGLLASDLGHKPADLNELIPIPEGRVDYPCRIGKYPITNSQYERFIEAGGYKKKKPWWTDKIEQKLSWDEDWRSGPRFRNDNRFNKSTHPVVGISWYEAMAYCEWLTGIWREAGDIGADEMVRLPKEKEWEAAAGSETYAWKGDFSTAHCNTKESEFGQTSPVHMYPSGATSEGVHDLNGNVWEWEFDDPGTLLGGAFWNSAEDATSAARHFRLDPRFRFDFYGYRVVVVPISHE